ncbi:DUF4041 domain-containing protein [Staphylococcus sciuri]|uniref:DUF4041 domain-containing protein n=1 Tax=Mammaliicoccus TaxID=2803850 RepID=UPI0018C93089|nr:MULTISPECIES: DUF4041 domain-containing protein [Mammaliicoccus]MBG9204595.1 DUF4041 domain-containing protein [Mammaliicoccus sciuri]
MSYYKNDFQVFKQNFNENELLSSKSSLIKDNTSKNGTIFITEEYFTYIREKEDFIYRIPLSEINDFESEKKRFTNSIFLVYGKKYSNKFEIIDTQEHYFITTLLNLLIRINKEDDSIKKHKIKEIDMNLNILKNKENETNEKLELLSKRETEIVRLNSDYEDKLQSKNLVLSNLDKEIKRNNEKIFKQNREIENLQQLINGYKEEHYFKEILVNHFEDTLTSKDLTDKLTMINLDEKDYIKKKLAINYFGESDTKRVIDSQSKQILRSFNTECDSLYLNVNSKNYEAYHKKISNAFETLNRLYAIDSVEITRDYLKLKLEKLSLIHAKLLKIEQEKEIQREIKAQMREEERVRREIENEKKKIEKEEKQFNNEVNLLLKRLEKAQNTVEAEVYAEKIRSLELKISELEKDKKDVLNREANTRAGYVYIISNIGSFGENIYKIGMTRRLEPTERIKELGDASVPFEFDIHAMIFSDDAPKLEKILHNHFRDRELNKVNHRKEFFNVHIDEIEELVIKEHNNTVEFVKIPIADQYWESQRLNKN